MGVNREVYWGFEKNNLNAIIILYAAITFTNYIDHT